MTPDDIRAIRASLNLTQAALAQRVGVSVHTVRGWEHGNRAPGTDSIARLQLLATPPVVRATRLVEALEEAADLADADAEADIAEGNPEAAEVSRKIAGHLRRIAANHRESGINPPQVGDYRA